MALSSKISKQQEIDVALNFFLRNTFRHSITPILFNIVIIAENYSYASKKINYHLGLKIFLSEVACVKIGCLLTLDL